MSRVGVSHPWSWVHQGTKSIAGKAGGQEPSSASYLASAEIFLSIFCFFWLRFDLQLRALYSLPPPLSFSSSSPDVPISVAFPMCCSCSCCWFPIEEVGGEPPVQYRYGWNTLQYQVKHSYNTGMKYNTTLYNITIPQQHQSKPHCTNLHHIKPYQKVTTVEFS